LSLHYHSVLIASQSVADLDAWLEHLLPDTAAHAEMGEIMLDPAFDKVRARARPLCLQGCFIFLLNVAKKSLAHISV